MCDTVAVTTIRELDELPDGTAIEILDRRGSWVIKLFGDWVDLNKPAGTTQNVYTYVNTRRYGARVMEGSPGK
ncbi:hypothetical protein [Streptomyces pseudovenezuelae]|uniref:hypothetical protein n=1 Tax=Streptomyces pseudovenezuelae TaxID=67350 RepID=UPI002E360DCC|nr:hypothetical protein [Streptomyces pseudovenezuelae]